MASPKMAGTSDVALRWYQRLWRHIQRRYRESISADRREMDV